MMARLSRVASGKPLMCFAAFYFVLGTASAGQTLFAIASWDAYGTPFRSPLVSGNFVDPDQSSSPSTRVRAWENTIPILGMDSSGRVFTSSVVGVSEPTWDMGDNPIHFSFTVDPAPKSPVLLWTGDATLEFVQTNSTTLNDSALTLLQQNSMSLVTGFMERRRENMTWNLKPPAIFQVTGTTWVVATTPVVIDSQYEGVSNDDRGWVFQVIDSNTGRIAWQHFSHPEWTSGDSGVVEVSADLFFRVEGNPQIFMLGIHGYGWESDTWAIFDLATGTPLSISD